MSENITAIQFFDKIEEENSTFDGKLMCYMGYVPKERKRIAIRERNEDYQKAREVLKASFIKSYDEKEENLKRVRKGDEIWRGIMANDDYIDRLIEGEASTGVCWTYKSFSARARRDYYTRNIHVILTASLISGESIDEEHSQLLTLNFAEENEVRLKYEEKILLKSIKIDYNRNEMFGDQKYPKGIVIPINKVVSTGELIAEGDGNSFIKRKGEN